MLWRQSLILTPYLGMSMELAITDPDEERIVNVVIEALSRRRPQTRHDAPNMTASGWSTEQCWADGYNQAVRDILAGDEI